MILHAVFLLLSFETSNLKGLRCKEILVKIRKSVDADIVKALLQVIHERISIPTCCLAIHAIKSTASETEMEQVTPKFLELLKVEKDCFVKCALLEALRSKALDPQVSTLGMLLTQDPVDTVRLAALELLMDQTAMDGFMAMLLRCMKDPSFSLSQLALVIVNSLPAEDIDTEEMAREVSQLLLHPDAKIRLAATEALSKMGSRGKSIALSALSASGPWPELDLEVRQKRDEAITTLQAWLKYCSGSFKPLTPLQENIPCSHVGMLIIVNSRQTFLHQSSVVQVRRDFECQTILHHVMSHIALKDGGLLMFVMEHSCCLSLFHGQFALCHWMVMSASFGLIVIIIMI